jgi:hypothetical protein
VRPAVEAEKLGLPTVTIATSGFTVLARTLAKSSGIDRLRIAEYPGPMGIDTPATVHDKIVAHIVAAVADGLLRDEPGASAAPAAGSPADVVFRGDADEIERHFAEQEWTDGLPIVPPTMARIERFLAYTDLAPDAQIGILPAANLRAVPLNVAANAVMAGCRPEHMPLLVAAVEALADERCNLYNIGSTSGLVPFLVVNGPIVRELGIEFGGQLISRGPNPALGRALGLIVRNLAGFRPARNYMGTFGYPLPFVLAEDPSTNPWPSFHVEQGFDEHDSTVTVGVTNNWGASSEPSATPDMSAAEVALELLCREIPKKFRLYDFPTIGPKAETVMVTLVLSPPVAKLLADAGYSKRAVREHVHEHARMPLREFEWITHHTFPRGVTVRQKAQAGVLPPEFMGAPDDLVRILKSPDVVHVVVCGDPNRNRLMSFEGGHTVPTTTRVHTPADWRTRLAAARR